MMRRRIALALATVFASWTLLEAQQLATPHELGIKYMRDSEEYAVLARQVYRVAGEAVGRGPAGAAPRTWAVVLDVDETALDNSTYQLERAGYGLPFDAKSWSAWINRRAAAAVPGTVGFVERVRAAGGRVAWISNRDAALSDSTRENLKSVGLWNDDDRLCLQKNPQHTKAMRRHEVVTGQGECAWPNAPARVAVFVGDQLGDFPKADEQIPQIGGADEDFGRTCFLLPNSQYGAWTTSVTRRP
jgi:5'-nucleotidase (lipoprotein e(P4) family)